MFLQIYLYLDLCRYRVISSAKQGPKGDGTSGSPEVIAAYIIIATFQVFKVSRYIGKYDLDSNSAVIKISQSEVH